MLCVAESTIAGIPVRWWAIWDRNARTMAEHTSKSRKQVEVTRATATVRAPPHQMQLNLSHGTAVETISLHGEQPIWTRKTPITVTGTVTLADRRFELAGRARADGRVRRLPPARDEVAWSAGVGTTATGNAVTWNLVTGLHDDPTPPSERSGSTARRTTSRHSPSRRPDLHR